MANELNYEKGFPVTIALSLANPGAGATTNLLAPQANLSGFVVPTGYKFHPMLLSGKSNADLTAGTATFKVTDDDTEIVGGPEPQLADTVQMASAVARAQVAPIAAGHLVGISVTTHADYAPTTADLDAVLVGVLLPAV
jgi:hypothetical protein